jgi:hypothetical protein
MGGAHVGRENILRNRRMENPVERGFLLLPTSGWDLPLIAGRLVLNCRTAQGEGRWHGKERKCSKR